MDNLSRQLINRYQGDLPLTQRPFKDIATSLDTTEDEVIVCLEKLLSSKIISRFGPSYNANCLGGALTLAAMNVPEADFDRISSLVNALPQVAHNYRREHWLNMWFVLATEDRDGIQRAIQLIENTGGLRVYNFPKLTEYYLGLWICIDDSNRVSTRSIEQETVLSDYVPSDLDRSIIQQTQAGLPIEAQPFRVISNRLGIRPEIVIRQLKIMLDCGVIRRIGAIPNHYKLGLKYNAMSVWNVDDFEVDRIGKRIGQLGFVSHCYRRPRYRGVWPYNLFAMVHGQTEQEVSDKISDISLCMGRRCLESDVLYSSAILKKTGLRLVA